MKIEMSQLQTITDCLKTDDPPSSENGVAQEMHILL